MAATTTTMHFGPEWMRAKPHSCTLRQQQPPSPPPQPNQLGVSTYSALVTPISQESDKRDESRPFRYTKDEMLRIYKEGGGRGGLNLEVERWEGIVRDMGNEPAGLREMTETEKKLFTGPLNSELRRRQSTDFANTHSDRQRPIYPNSTANNTIRYTPFSARRRDSTDQPPLALPRKLSLSNTQSAILSSPRDTLPSPRNRIGPFGAGFDGVLNGGDSWSRRRPSTSLTGVGGASVRGEGKEEEARHSEIKEEEESVDRRSPNTQDSDSTAVTDQIPSPGPDVSSSDTVQDDRVFSLISDSVGQGMASLSLDPLNQPDSTAQTTISSTSPPGLTDPASVEWSYLDPQGQIQGKCPFRADLMQKWFDEGYFTPDLLMKCTHIDADWIAVGVLERRVAGGKIFFPQVPNGPPGLAIRTESPKGYSPTHEQNMFNGYQTLRTTLDSLNSSSPVESPSSSLGVGRFGNGSPESSTFGGRPGSNIYSADPSFSARTFPARATYQDPISDTRSFSSHLLGRVSTIDTFSTYSGGGDNSPWSAGLGQANQSFGDTEQHSYSNAFNGTGAGTMGPLPVNHAHSINQDHFADATYTGMNSLGDHRDSPIARRPTDINGITLNTNMTNGLGSQFGPPSQFPPSPSIPYAAPRQSVSPFGDVIPQTSEGPIPAQTPISAIQPNSASPWATRSRAIEPRTSSPVLPPARPQAPEWIPPQSAVPVDPSPWLVASLPVVDDVWREMPGPNSLTFSNLGQHNKLQQQEEEQVDDIAVSPVESAVLEVHTSPATATTLVSRSAVPDLVLGPSPDTQASATPKSRRKSTARDVPVPSSKVTAQSTPAVAKEQLVASALSAAQPKPVWAMEDDSKKQVAGAPISLREIQEAEARKAEARKAAEKERERLSRTNTAGGNFVVEESQPFSSSWGLPTSQAGTRNQTLPKETPAVNSTAVTPAPVWTNTTSPSTAKKTMKEIQEEEERRKKLAVKESMATAAARRAYADTAVKVVPSAQTLGGPWTTVGPNGKATVPTISAPRLSANISSNNAPPTTVTRPNGATNRQSSVPTVKATTPRVDDFPVTPSHDFLKWLGESLKGLNSSVNLEEMTAMLLSFPLDPDQSTLEIISDLIYANSTTLDGRRFASEYVSKRKADAATRRGTISSNSSAGSKPVSIADVVKIQPKPVQQEWGFKVVNKKKKGGRS